MTKELENMRGTAQIEERLNPQPQLVYREELPIMSEEELQEAKSFKRECEIDRLRCEIRQDMMDYKLLWSDTNGGEWIIKSDITDENFDFFKSYLRLNINQKITKLMDIQGE